MRLSLCLVATLLLASELTGAQGLTGALFVTVKDANGGVLPGAVVRLSSAGLIGGPAAAMTNDRGQLRFCHTASRARVLSIPADSSGDS